MLNSNVCTSTGSKSAGGQTVAQSAFLFNAELISDGTNAATLSIYQGTSSSDVLLAVLKVPAATTVPMVVSYNSPPVANNGIFTVLTGTGATFVLHYSLA